MPSAHLCVWSRGGVLAPETVAQELGTIPDLSVAMRPLDHSILVFLALAIAACGHDSRRASRDSDGDVDIGRWAGMQGDALAAQADSLVRAGRPWRATALLAARLAAPEATNAELRLAGARAAAGWMAGRR